MSLVTTRRSSSGSLFPVAPVHEQELRSVDITPRVGIGHVIHFSQLYASSESPVGFLRSVPPIGVGRTIACWASCGDVQHALYTRITSTNNWNVRAAYNA